MDQMKKHNILTFTQSTQFYFSKKAIPVILLFSIFSFLYSNSSSFPILFPAISINLFSFSTDRNYIFLLCNGILVFIIKNSGLIANSAVGNDYKDNHVGFIVNYAVETDFKDNHVEEETEFHQLVPILPESIKTVVAEAEETEDGILFTLGEENVSTEKEDDILVELGEDENVSAGEKDVILVTVGEDENVTSGEEDENETGNENENQFVDIEEEEEEEIGLLSVEELNKKCDDFIKKMKEGIKIEAQQLMMV